MGAMFNPMVDIIAMKLIDEENAKYTVNIFQSRLSAESARTSGDHLAQLDDAEERMAKQRLCGRSEHSHTKKIPRGSERSPIMLTSGLQ